MQACVQFFGLRGESIFLPFPGSKDTHILQLIDLPPSSKPSSSHLSVHSSIVLSLDNRKNS
jgi:hypothetical protein